MKFRGQAVYYQIHNKDGFLSLDLGLREFGVKDAKDRLTYYRESVYKKGNVAGIEREREKGFELNEIDHFRYRTRYFTDSGIIRSKVFDNRLYRQYRDRLSSKHRKRPKPIRGLKGVYSLKRLSTVF